MAPPLVRAVAADRKIGDVGERSKRIQQVRVIRDFQFRGETSFERAPITFVLTDPRVANQLGAGRQIRKPHVEPILLRVLRLRHAARRTANRTESKTFARAAWSSQTHDGDRHLMLCRAIARDRAQRSLTPAFHQHPSNRRRR